MTSATKLCQIPECQVASTGKCHLGNDPVERCPNYGRKESAVDDVGVPVDAGVEKLVKICSGDVMGLEDTDLVRPDQDRPDRLPDWRTTCRQDDTNRVDLCHVLQGSVRGA